MVEMPSNIIRILFMREYPIIDSAPTVEQLKLRLKEGELEQYGEPFTPDFVYNVINRLPRFSTMRVSSILNLSKYISNSLQHGHQQDAEEFLGFLLERLHDECVQVMGNSLSTATSAMATPQNGPSSPVSEHSSVQGSISGQENGWLEVGPKQKAAITRSSGTIHTGSPITKIFGGNLRSEFRVPGLKDSVTLEPYQPLQLDIGAPNVNNIVDALKGLTRSEALHGDFGSPKGPNVTANKQVFIETLPPVLILHLKRFQYDNTGGTQKIWKKVGYPLELEIPKEVFSRQKRTVYAHSGLPKYRLIAVVYHHGKNASGGHYTVDVRRQDGKEWIRLDDTVIRRVKSEEVAEAGSEEDPKILAAALEAHKKDTVASGNGFAAIEGVEDEDEEGGWKKATSGSGKKWSSVVNGTSTPKAKTDKFSVKDNKVAYLLFYQKI
jgi:ubiquitin carboxyl-terminal hydrolase 10